MKQALATLASLLFSVMLAAPAANAASNPAASVSMASSGSIKFISGGRDKQSRERMQKMAADCNLLLNFEGPKKQTDYTGVNVSVTDDSGKVMLNAKAGGPLFYVEVPPGHYAVTADLDGKHLVQSVRVSPHEQSRLTFNWRT